MKVAIISAMWKRPEIFRLFASGILELKHPDIEFHTFIAGSEGKASMNLAREYGFNYIEIQNTPLARKHNQAIALSKKINPDYYLFLGSDDIMNSDTLPVYFEKMKLGYDFIGITDFYFYDTVSDKAAYWGGYIDNRKGHTVGAGRMVSKRLMTKWNFAPFDNKLSHVLDDSMQRKIRMANKIFTFSLKETNTHAIDIKSPINMTPFTLWPNTHYVDSSILNYFPCLTKFKKS